MAFTNDYLTGVDDTFRRRVTVAVVKAAVQIIGEAIGTMSTTRLGKRHDYAMRVISDPSNFNSNVPFVLAAAGLDTTATDAVLVSTLVSNWDKLSGVKSTEV